MANPFSSLFGREPQEAAAPATDDFGAELTARPLADEAAPPANLFVEQQQPPRPAAPAPAMDGGSVTAQAPTSNLSGMYAFMDHPFEQMGKDDALACPDPAFMRQRLELVKADCLRRLGQTRLFYQQFLQKANTQIESRKRLGMLDIVEEMETHCRIAQDHLAKVEAMEKGLHSGTGELQVVLQRYEYGFKLSLAAISHLEVTNVPF